MRENGRLPGPDKKCFCTPKFCKCGRPYEKKDKKIEYVDYSDYEVVQLTERDFVMHCVKGSSKTYEISTSLSSDGQRV